jgi:hypothetical protein
LEITIVVAEQDGDGSVGVGDDDIGDAVAVYVGDVHGEGLAEDCRRFQWNRSLKSTTLRSMRDSRVSTSAAAE